MEGERNHRLSASGRRVEDNVLAVQKLKNCFFLGGVKRRSAGFCPHHKLFQNVFGRYIRTVSVDFFEKFIQKIFKNTLVLLCHNALKITFCKKFSIFKFIGDL